MSDVVLNPWRNLPETGPFVVEYDLPITEAFNRKASAQHRLHFDLIPEPYLGNPLAPVVLLNANPGYPANGIVPDFGGGFLVAARANLLHAHPDWPLYLLDPALPSMGGNWWNRRLRPLANAVGGFQRVAQLVFVAETHGYHSVNYKTIALPSQRYTRELVLAAMQRDAVIIVMRARKVWLELVPELEGANLFSLNSAQNVTISQRNCPDGFHAAVAAIS